MRDAVGEPLLSPPPSSAPSASSRTSAFFAAVVNSLKSILGTGTLALPWAFYQLRLLPAYTAPGIAAAIGAWEMNTMFLMFRCMVLASSGTKEADGGYGGLARYGGYGGYGYDGYDDGTDGPMCAYPFACIR